MLTFDPLLNFFSDYELNLELPPQFRLMELLGFQLNEVSLFFMNLLLKIESEKLKELKEVVKIKGKFEDQLPENMEKNLPWFPHQSLWYEPIALDTLFDDSLRDTIKQMFREKTTEAEVKNVQKFADWFGKIYDLAESTKNEMKDEQLRQQGDIFFLRYKEAEDKFCKVYLTELFVRYGGNKKMVQEHTGMSVDWLDDKIKKYELLKPSDRQKSGNNR